MAPQYLFSSMGLERRIITPVLLEIKLRVSKFQSIFWQTFFSDMSMKNFLYAREKLGISKQIGSITDWEKDP